MSGSKQHVRPIHSPAVPLLMQILLDTRISPSSVQQQQAYRQSHGAAILTQTHSNQPHHSNSSPIQEAGVYKNLLAT